MIAQRDERHALAFGDSDGYPSSLCGWRMTVASCDQAVSRSAMVKWIGMLFGTVVANPWPRYTARSSKVNPLFADRRLVSISNMMDGVPHSYTMEIETC